jgi:hypothetical protein
VTDPGVARPARPAPFEVAPAAEGGAIDVDLATVTFDGFGWAVPALVLTVPGLLIILAVASQALVAMLLVPVARRWLEGDRRRGATDPRRWSRASGSTHRGR